MSSPILSLVVPCYNEEDVIPIFYAETARVIDEMNLYVVFYLVSAFFLLCHLSVMMCT